MYVQVESILNEFPCKEEDTKIGGKKCSMNDRVKVDQL